MLATDLVERDIGDTNFLGEMDYGLRPDEVVELAAREASAHSGLAGSSVLFAC